MDELLKSQIHENCKLALPEGLKDLMSDISREVLRAQPQNLYQFIANYLGALLEARETLTIACQVCSDICKCTCDHIKPELYHELRKIGLDEENVENAIEVIEKHLVGDQKANKPAKEQSLLLKLLRKTSINETQLPAIQQAIQKAFKRYSLSQGDLTDFRNGSTMETSEAIHDTIKLQTQNKQKETEEIFVAPDFKPRVTTISSVSLAGSYVPLPKFRPYCAHDYKIFSRIPEREHVSIHYTTVIANTTKTKPKKIEIKETSVIENDEKNEPFLCHDDDIHQNEDDNNEYLSTDEYYIATTSTGLKLNEATTSAGLKLNRVEVNAEDMEEPDKHFVSFNDSNDEMNTEGHSDDEVQEIIENVESESDSNVSSIGEALQNDRDG